MDVSDQKKPFADAVPPVASGRNLALARSNSRLAVVAAVICSVVSLSALIGSAYVSRTRNHVAVIPLGETWEYPMVHWVNAPSRYEEDAKPMHVAMKYVRGLYEIDPIDFSKSGVENETVMLSNRVAELMAYAPVGSKEHLKVSMALEKSQTLFRTFSECKCVKRFLVSDMMITQPPLPMLRIEMIGRFVIFGQDGRRPLPAEDLGYKSISVWLSNEIPIFDRSQSIQVKSGELPPSKAGDGEGEGDEASGRQTSKETIGSLPKAVNPEGWYVVRSQIRTINEKEIKDLRQLRLDAGMKGIY